MTGSIQYMIELVNESVHFLLQNKKNEENRVKTLWRYQLITIMVLSDDFDLQGLDPVDVFNYVCENTQNFLE
jgi:hypothetical protein